MSGFIWVGLGGAAGAMTRYAVGLWLAGMSTAGWPVATFAVNILGSMGIGVAFVLLQSGVLTPDMRALLMVGFFGGFTTFSTFSLEMLGFIERGEAMQAALYAVASVLCCLGAVVGGVAVMRSLMS